MANAPPVLKAVINKPRYAQDEVLQCGPLSADENYCIPSTTKDYSEHYVRSQLSFEDPFMEKTSRETNDAIFEVYDYFTLKLEAMYNGKSDSFPQLFTKEWDSYYSTYCPENESRERRRIYDYNDCDDDQYPMKIADNYKKDKKTEVEEKRVRKRMQRVEKIDKPKKFKSGRE